MKRKTARDIMSTNVVTVTADTVITAAIRTMLDHNVSTLPVLDPNRNLVGIVSEHDIINFVLSGDAGDTRVHEAMTTHVVSYQPDTELATLINCCVTKQIRVVPIVENQKVIGIVGRRNILREMLDMYNQI